LKYVVTGATGFLGANLVRALLTAGHSVRCLIRRPNICIEGLDLETSTVPLYSDEAGHLDALAAQLQGADGVFHVAGIFDPSPGGEARMRTVHVDATARLLAAAEMAGVPRFVLCSSSITVGYGTLESPGDESTFPDADTMYGRAGALRAYHDTKVEAETLVARHEGLEGIIVNPDFILGPWDVKPTSGQLIVTMAGRWIPFYPRGGKCFQSAEDCARGHLLAMERGRRGERYLLGSHNRSYQDFMGVVADVVGARPPSWPMPDTAVRAAGLAGRIGSRLDAHRFAGLDVHVLRSMQQCRYRTDARAREELGLKPGPLEAAVESAYRWFCDNGYC
jgi:dihydroflavonol-4-reductase